MWVEEDHTAPSSEDRFGGHGGHSQFQERQAPQSGGNPSVPAAPQPSMPERRGDSGRAPVACGALPLSRPGAAASTSLEGSFDLRKNPLLALASVKRQLCLPARGHPHCPGLAPGWEGWGQRVHWQGPSSGTTSS